MGIICPKCEKDDQIYKISGIVSSGSSSVRLSGRTTGASFPIGDSNPSIIAGYTDIEGEQTTDLAQKLAPLEKPTTKGNGSGMHGNCRCSRRYNYIIFVERNIQVE